MRGQLFLMKTFFISLLFLIAYHAEAQRVFGSVTDDNGNPLPFASIIIKNTHLGVTTNSEGYFEIQLKPGSYSIECRYIGYTVAEKRVVLEGRDAEVDFVMHQQQLQLDEIVIRKSGEDPAYEIIRNAIRQRPYYEGQVSSFSADVYVKGLIRLLHLPDKVLGKKVEEKDRKEMIMDSSGQAILYLSESLTHVSVQKPENMKMEVLASRVSGSNGFGFDFPVFIDFYQNNVDVSKSTLSKRGFVSPIADNALNFYSYHFMGSFFENGKQVNAIKVIPRRSYEPLFSGIINITEGDWRIFSCKLLLTSTSQLQILDTLEISQIHIPEFRDVWRIRNQSIYFHVKQLGIAANGYFVNVYSNYDLNPKFPKGFYDRVIIKYDSTSNKKSPQFWDSTRPVPLEPDEVKDYKEKDSLKVLRDSTVYNRDSLRKAQGKTGMLDILWTGIEKNLYTKTRPVQFRSEPLIKTIQYNTVEGMVLNPSVVLSGYSKWLGTTTSVIVDARYGFANRHLNPWIGFTFSNRKNPGGRNTFRNYEYFLAGGKRVSQFFKLSNWDGLTNSIATLLYGQNNMKLYENYFFKTGYRRNWESGSQFEIKGLFEDRLPLQNTTDFVLNKKWEKRLTPNYPVEILDAPFTRHQAVVLHASFSFQPGQRYIQYPNVRYSLGSDYPVFSIEYEKAIPGVFGSDEDFDKWQFGIKDDMKLRLAGTIRYNLKVGGFLNASRVFVQDYKHFHSSMSHIAEEYNSSFQYATDYQYSNQSSFFAAFHFEHHAQGLLTNKVPLLKRWNWYLVEGANALHVNPATDHLEFFVGLENIFKMFRFDVLMNIQSGYKPVFTYRIGFGGLLGDALNILRFTRNDKIIDKW